MVSIAPSLPITLREPMSQKDFENDQILVRPIKTGHFMKFCE
jgi:hypothetical protein